MGKRTAPIFGHYMPNFEALRDGTRDQYVSEWVQILNNSTHVFTHNLGEIPWLVSVIRSETSGGARAVKADADVIISAETDTTLTVENDLGEDAYFQVRAL